jgi:outer membrane protein assembly factor BamB
MLSGLTSPKTKELTEVPKHAILRSAAAAIATLALSLPGAALADVRCGIQLQNNVCLEAQGSCPVVPNSGPADTVWPMYQHDAQHTGKSDQVGPACGSTLWQTKVRSKILSSPAIGPAGPGQHGTLYVAAAKYPICALEPAGGGILWCDTSDKGKLPDYSAPALGNDGMLYIGTRDNDLWAIDIPSPEVGPASVAWRQKVCTDGDVTTPPTVADDGVVYMGSDSLGGGSFFAMCPGTTRRVKWCINPVGGGVKNVSPALSLSGDRVYITYAGAFAAAYSTATGAKLWSVQLESRRNGLRGANYTPVVHPVTGKIYVGFDEGLFEITESVHPQTNEPIATPSLLFATDSTIRHQISAPPAIDAASDTIYFAATRGQSTEFFAIGTNGALKWQKNLGRGRSRNLPPIVDAAGNVYVALRKKIFRVNPANGNVVWERDFGRPIWASPVIGVGRLYVGTVDGYVHAIGCP